MSPTNILFTHTQGRPVEWPLERIFGSSDLKVNMGAGGIAG